MTQDAARPAKGMGSSVAGWPLRRKIALALAVPLLLAAVLGGLRVAGDYGDSRQASRSAQQVTIIQPAVDYLTAAESAMVAAQSDSAASQGDKIDAIDDIVTNAEALTQARDSADLDDLQTAHVDALLDLSQAIRGDGAQNLGPATWVALVRQLESSVSQLITSVNAAQETPEPRLEQLSQTMSGRLSLALQQGLISTTLAQSTSQDLFSEVGVEAAAIDRLAGSVDGAGAETSQLRTQNTRHANEIRDNSATNLDGRDAYASYDSITQKLISGVTASLDSAASAAQRNALLGALLTLSALAAAIFLALLVARSLLEPISKVRDGALAVARHRLPDAVARIRAGQEPEPIRTIDVTTNEEIGQVARAVDDLHRQAIHLASGEAQLRQTVNAMFVTLSRRSTSLVNQQLAQIERLEHDEEDPKRLESLFRLDHLASRMRRTADSLLILADAPNRAAGQFSLSVGEALQAATSGVQDYQRVQILSHIGTRVSDEAAADVVHLLTELVDNALTYSPPAEPVRLAAKLGTDGVTITITDSGLGVPPAELEQLNRDLEHGAEASPDTARRMGLFVVSRLAERHGITATLSRNAGGGMTATIVLPPSVLPELPQTGAAAPTPAPAPALALREMAEALESQVPAAVPAAAPAAAVSTEVAESRREARTRSRAEKAEAKAAEKAAKKDAAARSATPVAEPEPVVETPVVTEDRPPLESLLPRREPGANMPRTGADAFLPPETSGVTGPLFGKREPKPVEEPAAGAAAPTDAPAAEQTAEKVAEKVARVVPITALAARQRAQAEAEARAAEVQDEPVDEPVEEPAAETPVEEPVVETPVAEPVADRPAESPIFGSYRDHESVAASSSSASPSPVPDPLSDPLPADAFDDEPVAAEEPAAEPVAEPVAEESVPEEPIAEHVVEEPVEEPVAEQVEADPVVETEPETEPAAYVHDEVEVDYNDPLGLGAPSVTHPAEPVDEPVDEPVVEYVSEPEAEPVVEEPASEAVVEELEPEPVAESPSWEPEAPAHQPAAAYEPAHEPAYAAAHEPEPAQPVAETFGDTLTETATRTATETLVDEPAAFAETAYEPGHASNGLSPEGLAPVRIGGDSPIFKSMRSGWLAGDGQGEFHETEVDRGWEIAEHVAEEAPVAESTVAGLPRRAPGERLVPGSVTPPTAAKTRDPEAIRRRLQAHKAGVSRGRAAAQSSTQHTEAGPA